MKNGFLDAGGVYVRAVAVPELTQYSDTVEGKILFRRKGRLSGRNKWLFTLVSLLCAVLLVGGTFALLASLLQDIPIKNEFTIGMADIEIEEDFNPGGPSWEKRVWVKNTGNVPGVARVMLVPVLKAFSYEDEYGNVVGGEGLGGDLGKLGEPTGNILVMGDFTFYFASDWSDNWFFQDGFFYCKLVLKPGETSPVLLESVDFTFKENYEGLIKHLNVDINVEVLADIIQSGSGVPERAWGVTVNSNGEVGPKQP